MVRACLAELGALIGLAIESIIGGVLFTIDTPQLWLRYLPYHASDIEPTGSTCSQPPCA